MECKFNKECGGCQYLEKTYQEELDLKQKYVSNLFKKIKYTDKIEIIGADDPYYYRNKVQMAFRLSKTKRMISGIYQEHSHNIVAVSDCLIQSKKINEVLKKINEVLTKNKIQPYSQGKGLVKHVLVRYGYSSKQLMVVIVTNSEMFPGRSNVVKDLLKAQPDITTIIQNINSRDTTIVLGNKERVLYGKGFISDKLSGLTFKISSKSFFQINPPQTEKLYNLALDLADIRPNQYVVDAYSGIGTIGLCASKQAKHVVCVENNPDAVTDAKNNAKNNNITNINFICEDSTNFLMNLADTKNRVDLLFMDPPRSGSTYKFIKSISNLKIPRVVYISCDPETLVRDLEIFTSLNYVVKKVKLVDMFPRTKHIETVCLCIKR